MNKAATRDVDKLRSELESIDQSLQGKEEITLHDLRWTQSYIAKAVLELADCVQAPRWKRIVGDTAVKWITGAAIAAIAYLFFELMGSGLFRP